MSDGAIGFLLGVLAGVLVAVLTATIFDVTYSDGCRDGQIDALTGNIKYELVTNPDSTREWVKK